MHSSAPPLPCYTTRIPDVAYVALTGDDKKTVTAWKKLNAQQRGGLKPTSSPEAGIPVGNASARAAAQEVAARAAAALTLADITWAAQSRRRALQRPCSLGRPSRRRVGVRLSWAAEHPTTSPSRMPRWNRSAPVPPPSTSLTPSTPPPPGTGLPTGSWSFRRSSKFPTTGRRTRRPAGPAGFQPCWELPWDKIKLQEKEFFASREPVIAELTSATARKTAINELASANPAEFMQARRSAEAESHFLRASGRYPLCGVGDVNTYSVFAKHLTSSIAPSGRSGMVTPTGLATDATTAAFFGDTLKSQRLAAFYDFENEGKIFAGVHNQFRFAVSCITGGERVSDVRLAFYTRVISGDVPSRRFALAADEERC